MYNGVYLYNAGTDTHYDLTQSVVSYKCRIGLQYDYDKCEISFTSPIIDSSDTEYVWGTDISIGSYIEVFRGFWDGVFYYECRLLAGKIVSAKTSKEGISAVVMSNTFFQSRKTITAIYTTTDVVDIFTDICADNGIFSGVNNQYTIYNPEWDIEASSISFNDVPIITANKRLTEFCYPSDAPDSQMCIYVGAVQHYLGDVHADPALVWANYGTTVMTANIPMSIDNGLISDVVWNDDAMRVLNDITIKYTGGSVMASDATSISTYGTQSSIICRPDIDNSTDAQALANSLVSVLKDLRISCVATCDWDYIQRAADSTTAVNRVFDITDPHTGYTTALPLKEVIISYPSMFCECVFDTLALNTSDYGITIENRVQSLESYSVSDGDSPTFTDITLASGGNIFNGAATNARRTIRMMAKDGIPLASGGCAPYAVWATSGGVMYGTLDFDPSSIEYADFPFCFPYNYDGEAVQIIIYWTSNDTGRAVVWSARGASMRDGYSIDPTLGTAVNLADDVSSADIVHIASINAVTFAGSPQPGDHAVLRIYRNATAVADTSTTDARLIGVALKYGIDAYSE